MSGSRCRCSSFVGAAEGADGGIVVLLSRAGIAAGFAQNEDDRQQDADSDCHGHTFVDDVVMFVGFFLAFVWFLVALVLSI